MCGKKKRIPLSNLRKVQRHSLEQVEVGGENGKSGPPMIVPLTHVVVEVARRFF